MKKIIIFLFLYGFFITPSATAVDFDGMAMPEESTCTGGINVYTSWGSCLWKNADADGLFIGPGKIVYNQITPLGPWFAGTYVPYAGMYSMRTHACPASTTGNCLLKNSAEHFNTQPVYFKSTAPIPDQGGRFVPTGGTLSGPSNLCLTLVNEADGSEWGGAVMYFCQDAKRLPDHPAFCYLNNDGSPSLIGVDLGSIERGTISTAAGTTTKKDVPVSVLCTGDAAMDVTLSFKFTPLIISGDEVASSNINGLGVAVFYEGNLVSQSFSKTITFTPGVNPDIHMGFEMVRDPHVPLSDIKTGDFKADVIMIVTQV